MMDLIAVLAYCALGLATAALVWAIREFERKSDTDSAWQPGTKPYNWRV